MANGPVRGKSWGGRHGRLPSTDWPVKCRSEHRIPFDREAGKDYLHSLRGTREAGKDSLDSLRGTREAGKINWTVCEALGRQERQLARHRGGRKGARSLH